MSFNDAVDILCEAIDRAEAERAGYRYAEQATAGDQPETATPLADEDLERDGFAGCTNAT